VDRSLGYNHRDCFGTNKWAAHTTRPHTEEGNILALTLNSTLTLALLDDNEWYTSNRIKCSHKIRRAGAAAGEGPANSALAFFLSLIASSKDPSDKQLPRTRHQEEKDQSAAPPIPESHTSPHTAPAEAAEEAACQCSLTLIDFSFA